MADVTEVPTPSDMPRPDAEGAADPRAVRVSLAATSRVGDEAPLRVAPPAEPLRPTNPTTGHGPLGGSAVPRALSAADASVLAQRHPVIDGVETPVSIRSAGGQRYVLTEDGRTTRVVLGQATADGGIQRREVLVDGYRFDVEIESERVATLRERARRGRAASAHSGPLEVRAIIPGRVASVSVVPGDAVMAGQQLLVVEAMKMQNELRSPRDGTISRVGVATGMTIEVGDLLVVIS